jgi:heme-degrading monooxygenase HmoA
MNLIPLTGQHGLFVINVFTVLPENQQALAAAIGDDAPGVSIPGLLSRHLLRSADGTQVAHCMHWASEDAFKLAIATNPVIARIKHHVHQLGARPNSYEIVHVPH